MLHLPIKIVAAVASNRAIGIAGKLPWYMPKDLKRFKELTKGSTVVMGRMTFESIGRPLPNRRNIVVTSKQGLVDGVETASSFYDALKLCAFDCFVIGGEGLYKEALDVAGSMTLTHVEQSFAGDTFFPVVDEKKWHQTVIEQGEDAGLDYRVVCYERIGW